MNERHLQYWGLHKQPFSLGPDPEMMFPSRQHSECLLRLRYGMQTGKGGAVVVSNNPGDGKTTVLYKLLADLKEAFAGKFRAAVVDHPALTPNQMIQEIASQLGVVKPSSQRNKNITQLRDRLLSLQDDGIRVLVAVDEGQMLQDYPKTLQELRILLNFVNKRQFLLYFVLLGQRELQSIVRSLPELWQRLPVRYFLGNLDRSDTRGLIRHRLRVAGCTKKDIFTKEGYETLYTYSEGIPRVICSVADLSLLIGYTSRLKMLDEMAVQVAAADLEGSEQGYHYYTLMRGEEEEREEEIERDFGPEPDDS